MGFKTLWARFIAILILPLLYLMTAAFLGTVIAYLICVFSQASAFDSLVKRSAQLLLVLGTYPLMRFFRLCSKELGIQGGIGTNFCKTIYQGFGLGLLIIAPVLSFQFALGLRYIHGSTAEMIPVVAGKIPFVLMAGFAVAVLEEWVFRGVFLGLLFRYIPIPAAIIVSAPYFAGLHFVEMSANTPVTLLSGLRMTLMAFSQWVSRVQWDAFFALFSVGILLGVVRWRLRSIGYCIGMHASWVVAIKTTRLISDLSEANPWLFLIGDFDGVNGFGTALWLMICSGILSAWGAKRHDL